jgi:hypothetical protein
MRGINDQIDTAYRTKYHRYSASFVTTMVSPAARATTMNLVPRFTSSQFNNPIVGR